MVDPAARPQAVGGGSDAWSMNISSWVNAAALACGIFVALSLTHWADAALCFRPIDP